MDFLSQHGSMANYSNLYNAASVISGHSSGPVDQFVFVRGNCSAEMKMSVTYMVAVKKLLTTS